MLATPYLPKTPLRSSASKIISALMLTNGKDLPSMPKVEVYTTPMCPFCWRAKRLLDNKNVDYTEIDLWRERDRRQEMVERADGRATVPQIFIDGNGIGGSDELVALESSGELDALLAAE